LAYLSPQTGLSKDVYACSERGTKLELGILINPLILKAFKTLDWDRIKEELENFREKFDFVSFPNFY